MRARHAAPIDSWTPVDGPHRAVALDIVRGLALLGVLVANTLTFAFPIASSPMDLPLWRGTAVVDRGAMLVVGLLVESRFYILLSVLFGVGLVIQAERAAAAGRQFVPFYLRRATLLFIIGLLHGVLRYSGDILTFYAIMAVASLPFAGLQRRALVHAAIVCGVLGIATLSVYAWTHPFRPYRQPLDWTLPTAQVETRVDFIERGAAGVLNIAGGSRQGFFDLMGDEPRIFQTGTWLEQTTSRAVTLLLLYLPSKVLLLGFIVLSFFLFGMSLARGGIARGVESLPQPGSEASRACRKLWYIGTPVGLALVVIGTAVQALAPRSLFTPPLYWLGTFGGVFLQALGYAAGILLLGARHPDGFVVRGLAAIGRTALSNYILQSVVLGTLFYSTGLGLFATLTAFPVVLLAFPVFALELWLTRVWLRRCTMGPVEWLWRRLAYRGRLPLRRAAAVPV